MPSEQAVIIKFKYGLDDLEPLFALEKALEQAIGAANVGEYDGHDIAVDLSDGGLYMYGTDADALLAVVLPHLRAAAFMKGAICTRRYGEVADPNAREVRSLI